MGSVSCSGDRSPGTFPHVLWHSVTVAVSPPEGHRWGRAPPAPPARSQRGGSAWGVLVLLTNNCVLVPRPCAGSGCSIWDNSPGRFAAGVSGPWCCVPLAGRAGGLWGLGTVHNIEVSLVSPSTQSCQCSVCAWPELWAGRSGCDSGISNPPGFPSPPAGRWEQVGEAQRWGELCHDLGITLEGAGL